MALKITKRKKEKEKIDFKHNLSLYWEMSKKYKWFYVFIILIVLIIEGIHVADKFLFKIVIDKGTEFAAGNILLDGLIVILSIVAGVYLGFLLIKLVGYWGRAALINRLDAGLIFDIKQKFFNHIVQLDHNFHTTHRTGSMISRMSRGSRAVERMTDFLVFNLAPLFLQLVIVGITFAYFDLASSVVVVITVVSFILFSFIMSWIQQSANLRANDADDIEKGNMSDIFANIDSIKYYGKESFIRKRYDKLAKETKRLFLRLWDFGRWFDVGQSLILGLGTFFLVFFPIMKFLDGEITIGTIAFIYTAYFGLMGPLYGFVHSMRRFYEAMADFQALFYYGKLKNSIEDEKGAKPLKVSRGKIDFKNVRFSYHKRKILDNVNLDVQPGEKVAFVGYSGSGKTTMVKLLYRLYDVNSGEIKIDGKNIKEFKQESLRGELSIVPQEAILFDDTIYNNIAFSRPASKKVEVMRAIRFAQLDKFVRRLPDKEDTIVGERGVKLSGGEKQRVSIARAILADKKILVLDEATSSLDSQTEWEIQRDLERLMKGRTSIIIAHRLSTIMNADKIVVMKRGKIVQVGKHEDLIKEAGVYRELWELQKGGYIEE